MKIYKFKDVTIVLTEVQSITLSSDQRDYKLTIIFKNGNGVSTYFDSEQDAAITLDKINLALESI